MARKRPNDRYGLVPNSGNGNLKLSNKPTAVVSSNQNVALIVNHVKIAAPSRSSSWNEPRSATLIQTRPLGGAALGFYIVRTRPWPRSSGNGVAGGLAVFERE